MEPSSEEVIAMSAKLLTAATEVEVGIEDLKVLELFNDAPDLARDFCKGRKRSGSPQGILGAFVKAMTGLQELYCHLNVANIPLVKSTKASKANKASVDSIPLLDAVGQRTSAKKTQPQRQSPLGSKQTSIPLLKKVKNF